ncbi:uncharacterized protein UTRI_04849 [Ustilago trichophora]|uniref:Uncharacterized protein n=1 Tax=Ustilago trichophora TaxID=86804 RepID=A0A5C3ED96_9BASI|nr:uncharacterized protein UTRI_04849 [Ustilago trichophora]
MAGASLSLTSFYTLNGARAVQSLEQDRGRDSLHPAGAMRGTAFSPSLSLRFEQRCPNWLPGTARQTILLQLPSQSSLLPPDLAKLNIVSSLALAHNKL